MITQIKKKKFISGIVFVLIRILFVVLNTDPDQLFCVNKILFKVIFF